MTSCDAGFDASMEQIVTTSLFVLDAVWLLKILLQSKIAGRVSTAFRSLSNGIYTVGNVQGNLASENLTRVRFRTQSVEKMRKRQLVVSRFVSSKRRRLNANIPTFPNRMIIEDTQSIELSRLQHAMFHFDVIHLKLLTSTLHGTSSHKLCFPARTEEQRDECQQSSAFSEIYPASGGPAINVRQSAENETPLSATKESRSPNDCITKYLGTNNETAIVSCSPICGDLDSGAQKNFFSHEQDIISGKLYGKFHGKAVLMDMCCHKHQIGMCSSASTESLLGDL